MSEKRGQRKGRNALVSFDKDGNANISLPSDISLDHGSDIAHAVKNLMEAVGEEVAGAPFPVKLGEFRIVCDGCGIERPVEHEGWKQTDTGHDYCPTCQKTEKAA